MNMSAITSTTPVSSVQASVKKRCEVLAEISSQLAAPVGDVEAKLLYTMLFQALHSYSDRASCMSLQNLISTWCSSNPKQCGAVVMKALTTVGPSLKLHYFSRVSSKNAAVSFTTTCTVMSKMSDMFTSSDNAMKMFIGVQSLCFMATVANGQRKSLKFAKGLFLQSIRSDHKMIEKYIDMVMSKDLTFWDLPFMAFLLNLSVELGLQTVADKHMNKALDRYVELLFLSKTPLPEHILLSSGALLKITSHDQFSAKVMPGLKRATLRTPELAVLPISIALSMLTIDLSRYIKDLLACLGPLLASPNEVINLGARDCFLNLFKGISESEAVTDAVTGMFAILDGAHGKITAYAQRIIVVKVIGKFSQFNVSGSANVDAIALSAAEKFLKYMKTESNEFVTLELLAAFGLWGERMSSSVPQTVIDFLKTNFTKGSTSHIRIANLLCAEKLFAGDTLPQLEDLEDTLIKTMEKASSNPNNLSIAESYAAGSLLLKLASKDLGDADSVVPKVLDSLLNKSLLDNIIPKVLSNINDEECSAFIICIKRILFHFKKNIFSIDTVECLVNILVELILTKSHLPRKETTAALRELVQDDEELCPIIIKYLISVSQNYTSTDESPFIARNYVGNVENIFIIVSTLSQETKETAVFDALLLCHNSTQQPDNKNLLQFVADKCQVDLYNFGEKYKDKILELVVTTKHDDCYQLVKSLSKHCITLITPLFNLVLEEFENPQIRCITREDIEIYRTPAGTLWKTSLLEEFEKSQVQDKNIKRESKLYSVEDQKWEQEMREMLARQKGMKLTNKQQSELDARLADEDVIRNHVILLKTNFKHNFHIMMATLSADIGFIMHSISKIASSTMTILDSPLTAKEAVKLLIELTLKIFPASYKELGFLLGRLTIRLHDPPCKIDPEWLGEPLNDAFARCITMLQDMMKSGFTLPSASFALAFPFLRYLVSTSKMTEDNYSANASIALEVMLAHVRKRASAESMFDGPTFMPREDLLRMCCTTFVRQPFGDVGKNLLEVMREVCVSGSGAPGCAIAGEAEIAILVDHLTTPNDVLRCDILKALLILNNGICMFIEEAEDVTTLANKMATKVWLLKHDVIPNVQAAAMKLWDYGGFSLFPAIIDGLLLQIISSQEYLQVAASLAIKSVIEELEDCIPATLDKIMQLYKKKTERAAAVTDDMGRILVEAPADHWEERVGICLTLTEIIPYLVNEQILFLIHLIVPAGLSDRSPVIVNKMLEVGIKIIDVHGKLVIDVLLPVFEGYLDNTPDSRANDQVKQSVVILMASLARHLNQDDPKVKPIVCKLMEALSTPSEQVQAAVAKCLAPLVPAIKDIAPLLVKRILYQLLESENYGERRGAAYGLAGLVKGMGLLSLKQLEIMPTLIDGIQNKKNFKHREGSLMAFEQLCTMMGTLFEPYVINVLPHLLVCFGDGNQYVREATEGASKAIMAKLSGHGVKLVLPSLLKALTEDSWRTKAGSVELLGAMAYCNPKQLSSCLPNIVPRLIEVMADSHVKVQRASHQSLKQIGSVIKNPEIQAIVPLLLNALAEPAKHTERCLDALIKTSFVHRIDAPSLALIVPVLTRSFEQRSTDTKKVASQIIGSILILTEEKDLKPYLNSIIPGLKSAVLDPVPDVRLYSAKALGSLVKGIGEIDGLMDWLLETLVSEQSSVDRSGAAQGISEVMTGLGTERLDKTMQEVLVCLEDDSLLPHIREGYLMLFIYMPLSLKEEFSEYIGVILTPILTGLASESEFVRDTSYRAGQRIVQQYADSAISLFLPKLEDGLFHDNYRIRLASCQLLGDLLYKIMGVTGKQSTISADEDDNFGTDEAKKLIINVLGAERRNRVFSGLYMARSDVALTVRQAGLHVWKIVVTNTPKTLKEILPVLIELILGCLASESYDKRAVASRTLGDLVKKLGDRILPEVIPILECALTSDDCSQRQGVCLGLSEIVSATSKEMVEVYSDSLLPAIRAALIDPNADVRKSAATTFAALHTVLGPKALDEILSPLLGMMGTLEGDQAVYLMGALKEIMAAKSRVVLPYMVPKLITTPVNISALASLSTVAGEALNEHIATIITSVIEALCLLDEGEVQAELENARSIVNSVEDEEGHEELVEILTEMLKSEEAGKRRYSALLLESFCASESIEITDHITDLWKALLGRFSDEDEAVVKTCWTAFNIATKRLTSGDQVRLVPDLKMSVNLAVDVKNKRNTEYTLPGFCLPKGLHALVALYREGILNGSPELKEQAISGLKEAIQLTNQVALKPSVVQITGPLIRVLGERYTPSIKIACLDTLSLLIDKVKVALKPFLSQLQTTFMKSLIDPTREVRSKGVIALTKLVSLHNRVDNLFTDLHSVCTKHADINIRETMLSALHGTMYVGGKNMSAGLATSIGVTLMNNLGAPEDQIRASNAACIGSLATVLGDEELLPMIQEHILTSQVCDWTIKHGRALAMCALLKYAPQRMAQLGLLVDLTSAVVKYMDSDKVPICNAGNYAAGRLIIYYTMVQHEGCELRQLADTLANNCAHQSSNDVRSFATNMVHMINISDIPPLPDDVIMSLLAPLLDNTTKKIPLVRSASEVAIATLLRLKSTDDIANRISPTLDPKNLEIFNRFLPTAKRVANDFRTDLHHENDIFAFLPTSL